MLFKYSNVEKFKDSNTVAVNGIILTKRKELEPDQSRKHTKRG